MFGSEWPLEDLMDAGLGDDNEQFHKPISSRSLRALAMCSNLTDLSIHSMSVSAAWLHTIADLALLETIRCANITMDNGVKDWIRTRGAPRSRSVVDLTTVGSTPNAWYLAAVCPSLRTLNMNGLSSLGLAAAFPDPDLQATFNPFVTLERFSLHRVLSYDAEDMIELCAWISAASAENERGTLPLTHMDITTRHRMRTVESDAVISILYHTALTTLVLGNLGGVNPGMLQRIACVQPRLRNLTIVHRPTEFHDDTCANIWPHPSWEYARALQGFHSLAYFGWNDLDPLFTATPQDLRLAEEGYPDKICNTRYLELYFPRDTSVPRLFATYCTSLETMFALEERGSSDGVEWRISRDTGRINVEERLFARLDPEHYPSREGWPNVCSRRARMTSDVSLVRGPYMIPIRQYLLIHASRLSGIAGASK